MLGLRLYLAQRISALLMAPLVLLHLGVMIYAIQGGLTAAEILGRTQGSYFWGLLYGLFVVVISIHAAIGLRVITYEWAGVAGSRLNLLTALLFLVFLCFGGRAVYAVVVF